MHPFDNQDIYKIHITTNEREIKTMHQKFIAKNTNNYL